VWVSTPKDSPLKGGPRLSSLPSKSKGCVGERCPNRTRPRVVKRRIPDRRRGVNPLRQGSPLQGEKNGESQISSQESVRKGKKEGSKGSTLGIHLRG